MPELPEVEVTRRGFARPITGAVVRGVRPQDLADTKFVFDSLTPAERESFGKGAYGGDRILIGAALANSLGVRVGDPITL